jgi:integrase
LLYIRGERKYLNRGERLRFYRAAEGIACTERRLLCLTLLFTGCRISEALNLPASAIDEAERSLIFRTLKQRGGERYRSVPVPASLIRGLKAYAGSAAIERDARIWPRGRTWAWERVKACMREAGLTGIKAVPKGLRHGFAVACVENNVPLTDIQEMLGHAKLETTKIYLTLVGNERRALVSRTWPKMSQKSTG